MNILMWREKVIHDDEVNLSPSRQLHSVKSIEPRQQSMWVELDMLIVLFEDLSEELMFRVVNRFDDEAIVP